MVDIPETFPTPRAWIEYAEGTPMSVTAKELAAIHDALAILPDLPPTLVWDQTTFADVWPTHYWCAGSLKRTSPARYKVGDTVQQKQGGHGPVTVERLQVTQYRWAPPEVVYHLSNGGMARDWQVW